MNEIVPDSNAEDNIIEESLETFRDYLYGKKTQRQLAEKYGVSQKTISNRVNKAREVYYTQIKEIGKKYAADILMKYDKIYDEAMEQWDLTKDPAFLQVATRTLADIRAMLKIDEIEQVHENKDKIIFVIDTSKYDNLEKKLLGPKDEDVVDGNILT